VENILGGLKPWNKTVTTDYVCCVINKPDSQRALLNLIIIYEDTILCCDLACINKNLLLLLVEIRADSTAIYFHNSNRASKLSDECCVIQE